MINIPQVGNDEIANIREHTCKTNWDGLQSSNTFYTILVRKDEEKALTTSNQLEKKQKKWCQCGSIKHLIVTSKYFPVRLAIIKAKRMALGMGLSKSEAKKAAEDAAEDEDRKCLAEEATGKGEKYYERES